MNANKKAIKQIAELLEDFPLPDAHTQAWELFKRALASPDLEEAHERMRLCYFYEWLSKLFEALDVFDTGKKKRAEGIRIYEAEMERRRKQKKR